MLIIKSFAVAGTILHEGVKIAAFIFLLLFLCPLIAWVGIAIVKYFVGSITNINSSGDSLFDELDNYNTHWGETKEYLCTCLISVGLSICATLFLDYMRAGDGYPTWHGIIGIVLFFAVVLIKYSKIFNEGSNQIYKYELDLLDKRIKKAEKKVSFDYKREEMMLTKQNVILILIDKCKLPFGKKCDDIVKDIRIVERINLNVEEYADYEEIKFFIGKTNREGILYVGKNNKLINHQYEKLYEILRKYDLIYKIENVENSREDMLS